MKRKCRKAPVLLKLLFPETYMDVEDAFLQYMPYLRMDIPEIRNILESKIAFVTLLAIGNSLDSNYDVKEEAGKAVDMSIVLGSETYLHDKTCWMNESRQCDNYLFVKAIVEGYAQAFQYSLTKHHLHK